MTALVLREDILEKCKTLPTLFGDVAATLDTTPSYALALMKKNDPKLTQASVLRVIKNHLGELEDRELLEEKEVEAA
jgi:hypothetical protein